MYKVGFIGLGAMGRAMAHNISHGGFPLRVYNRSRAATIPFAQNGIPVCDNPREVAGRSDVTVIMVTGPVALSEVLEGNDGVLAGLTPGKIVLNMSTVSTDATEAAAAAVRAKGGSFVDAPVSGTVKPAQEGKLVILAGAENGDLTRLTPLLKTMGQTVLHCGGVGQGTRTKLVLNLILGNMMQSLAEGMMLSRGFGLDPATVLEALGSGAMAAPLFKMKGDAILRGDFDSQFPVHLMFKDLNLVTEAAGHVRIPLPQTSATRECFNAAMAKGYGDKDMAAVVKILENLTGRTVKD